MSNNNHKLGHGIIKFIIYYKNYYYNLNIIIYS